MNNRQNGRRRGRNNPRPQGGNRGGFDSGNRIDSRARGNAAQLLEKYKNMARDAQMSGDRVLTEYYLQFADHYFRVLSDSRTRQEEQRARFQDRDDEPRDDQDEGEGDEFDAIDAVGRAPRQRPQDRAERQDRPRRDDAEGDRQPRRNGYDSRDGERGGEDRPRAERQPRRDEGDRYERGDRDSAPRDGGDYQRRERGGEERRYNRERSPRRDDRSIGDGVGSFDDTPAAIDIAVLPPAIGAMDAIPMRDDFDLSDAPNSSEAPDTASVDAPAEEAPAPRRRGRPRKVVVEESEG